MRSPQHHRPPQHRQRRDALYSNTTGNENTAFGNSALYNTSATGIPPWDNALPNSKGYGNTALGQNAGYNGNSNGSLRAVTISISATTSAPGSLTESGTIRIGNSDLVTKPSLPAFAITRSSALPLCQRQRSARRPLPPAATRKISGTWARPAAAYAAQARDLPLQARIRRRPRTLQYGLIAEEVAEVYPDLVQYDPKTGEPQTVSYHLVNAMLLNEVQKQHRHMLVQDDRIKAQTIMILAEERKC